MPRACFLALLPALALLGACPGTTSTPDAGGSVTSDASVVGGADGGLVVRSTDLSDLCAPIAAWECARAATCGCKQPSGSALDEAWCKQVREAACIKELQQGLSGLEQGLAQGAVAVRVDRVADCVAAYEAGSPPCTKSALVFMSGCADTLEIAVAKKGDSCPWSAFPCGDGTRCTSKGCATPAANGAACQEPGECASRSCVDGKCAELGASGAACIGHAQCRPPLVCLQDKCAALAAKDAACIDTVDCAPPLGCVGGKCAEVTPCSSGEVCGNEGRCLGPVSSACKAAGQAGAACAWDSQCAAGTACDGTAKKCVALPGDGETCTNGVSCAAGFGCVDGQGQCAALGGAGSTCLMGAEGPFLCASGSVCSDSGSCIADPKEGDPCGIPNACGRSDADQDGLTDLVCAFGPGGSTCVARQAKDATCENDICAAGLFCDFNAGTCQPTYAKGAACKNGNECGPGQTCAPDELQVLRCQTLPALGAACFLDCASGAWCERTMTATTCQAPLCAAMFQLQ